MTLDSGEFYITNPYKGGKRAFSVKGGIVYNTCYN